MTSTVLTDAEKNACLILADLFLDIEVTSNELDYMARSLDKLNLLLSTLNKFSATIFSPSSFTTSGALQASGWDSMSPASSSRLNTNAWTPRAS